MHNVVMNKIGVFTPVNYTKPSFKEKIYRLTSKFFVIGSTDLASIQSNSDKKFIAEKYKPTLLGTVVKIILTLSLMIIPIFILHYILFKNLNIEKFEVTDIQVVDITNKSFYSHRTNTIDQRTAVQHIQELRPLPTFQFF